MLLEKTGYGLSIWVTYSKLSLKYFYWLGVNPVRALLVVYSKLFVSASIKRLDCRNKLVSPCKRLSDCHSFRFVTSKSQREKSPTSGAWTGTWKEGWTKWRALQKEVSRMGQHSSKISFISIMHHFLKQNGVNVSRDQLNGCYHILREQFMVPRRGDTQSRRIEKG